MSLLLDAFLLSLSGGIPLRIALALARRAFRRGGAAPAAATTGGAGPVGTAGAATATESPPRSALPRLLAGALAPFALVLAALYLWSAPVRAEIPGGEVFMAVAALCWGLAEAAFRARPPVVRLASGLTLATLVLAVGFACLLFGLIGSPDRLFRGRTLLALVRITPGVFEEDVHIDRPPVVATVQKGAPRVDMEVRILEGGRPGDPRRARLAGDQWGVGMQTVVVKRWMIFLGERVFYRVTSAEAKFADNRIPHYGEEIEHPLEAEANLKRDIPLVGQTLEDISGAKASSYQTQVFVPVRDGEYFAIWASPGGAPIPEKITPEEWARRTTAGP